ncbi:MAG: hypothetical protein SFU85_02970 [Candidatus Methylacidiphilales bacterium]|nr:hypothetical protein [Candidatus Methylacidiphilales bacterium]
MRWLFRTVFSASILGAGVAWFFFFVGLMDGSVSSFNGLLWTGLLLWVSTVPVGGYVLHVQKHPWVSLVVLLTTALPVFVGLVFVLVILMAPPRWN